MFDITKKQIRRNLRLGKKKLENDGIISTVFSAPPAITELIKCSLWDMTKNHSFMEYKFANKSADDFRGRYDEVPQDDGDELIHSIINKHANSPHSIIELGTNKGPRLEYLRRREDYNLHGIELNKHMPELMQETFPELHEEINLKIGRAQDRLPEYETEKFDVLFFISAMNNVTDDAETLFNEIARVTNDIVIAIEVEKAEHGSEPEREKVQTKVYRDLEPIFTERGFECVEHIFSGDNNSKSLKLRTVGGEGRLYTAWVFKQKQNVGPS